MCSNNCNQKFIMKRRQIITFSMLFLYIEKQDFIESFLCNFIKSICDFWSSIQSSKHIDHLAPNKLCMLFSNTFANTLNSLIFRVWCCCRSAFFYYYYYYYSFAFAKCQLFAILYSHSVCALCFVFFSRKISLFHQAKIVVLFELTAFEHITSRSGSTIF